VGKPDGISVGVEVVGKCVGFEDVGSPLGCGVGAGVPGDKDGVIVGKVCEGNLVGVAVGIEVIGC